jgi:hypothetical protein
MTLALHLSRNPSIIPPRIGNDLAKTATVSPGHPANGRSFAAISRHMSYLSGWYTVGDEQQILFAIGVHGQKVFVDRKHKIAVNAYLLRDAAIDGGALKRDCFVEFPFELGNFDEKPNSCHGRNR